MSQKGTLQSSNLNCCSTRWTEHHVQRSAASQAWHKWKQAGIPLSLLMKRIPAEGWMSLWDLLQSRPMGEVTIGGGGGGGSLEESQIIILISDWKEGTRGQRGRQTFNITAPSKSQPLLSIYGCVWFAVCEHVNPAGLKPARLPFNVRFQEGSASNFCTLTNFSVDYIFN